MLARYGYSRGWGRRYLGFIPTLLGVLVLVIMTIASCRPDGPGLTVFTLGVVVSVGLGWLGYNVQRRRPGESSAEIPLETQAPPIPSTQAIRPVDVLGPWRFYIDAASATVTVDLKADGRYTQVIVSNRGERIDCPGGTWTLDGPYVELTSYRSAALAATDRVRWFFGQWQNDLVLFAKDDPQGETILQGRKVAFIRPNNP